MNIDWTDERIIELKDLWGQGLSAAQVGAALGCSRSAVIGKLHRLCVAPRERKVTAKPAPRKHRRSDQWKPRVAAPPLDPAEVTDLPPDQSDHAVTIHELAEESCRYPLGEPSHSMMYCGAAKLDGHPYCARHCSIAYAPRRAPVYVSKAAEAA